MKTATVRELRNEFSKLEAWLADGQEIEIQKRGEPIALLSARKRTEGKKIVMPDFAARRKKIWGDRFFGEEEVKAMKEYELEGQEG